MALMLEGEIYIIHIFEQQQQHLLLVCSGYVWLGINIIVFAIMLGPYGVMITVELYGMGYRFQHQDPRDSFQTPVSTILILSGIFSNIYFRYMLLKVSFICS